MADMDHVVFLDHPENEPIAAAKATVNKWL